MAKREYIKNKNNEIVFPVTKEELISDNNNIALSSKLAEIFQTANNAYQKPPSGIPASDIAEGVIPDVSSFVTSSVNNLVNYYLKSETYTKTEVDSLIHTVSQFAYEVADSLPNPPSAETMYKIYLIPSASPKAQNVKDEFITIQSGAEGSYTYTWEQIGSTSIDLSGYVTTEALNTALSNYTTTEQLTTLLASKQDIINDLSSIRSGASAGATAYQKPASGIPASDLASGVIPDISGKQDTLISGENIKTINNQSLLGSGNITIQGGGGGVSDVTLGGSSVVSEGVAVLPAYPTTLPASDVSSWAKQSTKPSYDYSEIGNTPSIPSALSELSDDTMHRVVTDTEKSTWDAKYSKPTGGIPSSDLASAVQTSLGKADTAYQKPSGGIPASDMASGVIPDPVTANPTVPSGTTPATLSGLKVGDNYFNVPSGGGGGVSDVTLGGTSVVSSGVAVLPAYPTVPTISTDIATDKASDTKTASPKAVYDGVHPAVGSSQPAGGMLPNVFYDLGTLSGDTTFAFATASDNTIENEWMFEFTTPSTAPTITWPNAITGWAGGTAPTINASKTYQVSVLNGLGVIVEF